MELTLWTRDEVQRIELTIEYATTEKLDYVIFNKNTQK